ncbi:hypothetical protein LPTSP4_12110 [Leptospira ryugenii]|uniref:3-oxo-5-alpha-steroid 4-dehydrogenase C-terminal domain-containing protein n=1 Tax=Leptospira ryugenii TaxID=1917863 RepID=A0A2P2DYJ3_9LEPT|nr:hypothetical protein [Leptospira ryugenii]GBF49695.1 hypothetical protein LPTSP4_12110 [Leptospira ryugenii]
MINIPPFSDSVLYSYAFYIFLSIFAFKTESSGFFNLPYSKFNKGKGISPRFGMFIIYFLPILAYWSTGLSLPKHPSPYAILLFLLFAIHFGKRCLEVLFLHKFSGKIGWTAVIFISFAYSNIGFLSGNLHYRSPEGIFESVPSFVTLAGLFLFFLGQAGNLYHHIILRNLRSNSETKEYKVPDKGLFKILVCPHYFFELISWFGFAMVSTYLDMYFVFFIMAGYLAGRSHQTRLWYLANVENFPKDRKRILPYIY